jgi:hypothetical protein
MPMAAIAAETARAKAAEALKAPLASPTFTGTVTAPTPTVGDNSTKVATTAFVAAAGGTSGQAALAPTAVKTSSYTATVSDFVPVDATGGTVAITLPTAPVDKARVSVKKIDSSLNTVTIAAGGSDVFNKAGGSTTLTISVTNQAINLQYASATGIWYVQASDLGLTALDARYPLLSAITAKGDILAAPAAGALARLGVGSNDQVLTADSSQTTGVKWSTVPVGVRQRISFGDPWEPTNFVAATLPDGRWSSMSGAVGALSTGKLYLAGGMILPKGVPVNFLSVIIGSTAGASMTHFWMCLVSQNLGTVLAITVDDTTAALTADTHEKLATTATYTPAADTPAYFGICAVGTTVPTLLGWNGGATGSPAEMATESPTMAGITTTSPASLTTPASLTSISAIATPNFRIPFGRAWS